MKRIISVTLLVVLMLFAFAGCDGVEDILQNFINSTNPTGSVHTTITEAEWLAAMDSGNFTVDIAASLGAQSTTQHIEYTESSRYQNQTGSPMDGEFYYTQIDDLTYEITKQDVGYVAREVAGGLVGGKLGDISNLRDAYSNLVYDEATSSYKYNYTDDYDQTFDIAFYFNNGSIQTVKMSVTRSDSVVVTYDFYDFGTTVIELPEYTFETENEPTVPEIPTITEEQWLAAMDSGNFTVDIAASLGAQSTTQHIEYTESSRYQNQTGSPMDGEFYYTQIDDLTYEITKQDVGYVAREVAGGLVGGKLGDISNLRDAYSNLVYDEATSSYKYNYTDDYDQTFDIAFYFNNGSIQTVKMSVTRSDSVVVTYDFYDFGITTIELPEFTFAS